MVHICFKHHFSKPLLLLSDMLIFLQSAFFLDKSAMSNGLRRNFQLIFVYEFFFRLFCSFRESAVLWAQADAEEAQKCDLRAQYEVAFHTYVETFAGLGDQLSLRNYRF